MSRREPRQRGCLSRLLSAVVVLLLLALVLDRGGRYVAEQVSASSLETSEHLASKPSVHIAGFPFLDQFASGRYDEVTVDADEVAVPDAGRLRLSHVRVVLRRATASRDFRTFTARRGAARATISYADLSRAVGLQVRYAGNGRVSARARLSVAGVTVSPRITVAPKVVQGVLGFTRVAVDGLAQAGPVVTQALNGTFKSLPVGHLPFDITVTSLEVTRSGLVLSLTGKDLRYTR